MNLASITLTLIRRFSTSLGIGLALIPAVLFASPPITANALRAHAEFLASDLLEGRAAGSRGYDLAAAYVSAQFRQYGLATLANGQQEGYRQQVPLIEATTVLPASSVTLRRDNQTETFEFNRDYLPAANFFNANVTLTAPLAFAGFAITAPELNYDDLATVDLQGRVAIVLDGAPDRFSREAAAWYGWRNTKYANLAKRGAVGVIEVPLPDAMNEHNWERAISMSWVSDMRLWIDDQPQEPFPSLRLRYRFRVEAAAKLFPTNNGPAINGHSLQQSINNCLAGKASGYALPGSLNMSATTGLRRVDSDNVLGVIHGSDDRLRNEYVLVVSPLDHLGRGAAVNGDAIYNGLQHNAVGVSLLLELARGLSGGDAPRRSILFAAVTAGDRGAQGLTHLLSSNAGRNIVASVVLDTPLPLARTSDVIAIGSADSSLGALLSDAAQSLGLRLTQPRSEDGSLLSASLAPLTQAGIPVLQIQSGVRARDASTEVRSLRHDFKQNILAEPNDDGSVIAVNWTAARELAQLNQALLLKIANAEHAPLWYRSSLIHRKLSSP